MSKLRTTTDPVSSSASDPIDRWLDVFVRLLRLSPAESQRIRDELEDHLRARVDDLMLVGHTEPDAVRTAVTELGETAELARQFQSAAKPRRRLTMLAGSAIVSAGLVVGAVLMTQSGTPSAAGMVVAGGQAADQTTEPVFLHDIVSADGEPDVSFRQVVDGIDDVIDEPLIVHYGSIFPDSLVYTNIELLRPSLPVAGLSLEQGLTVVSNAMPGGYSDPLVIQRSDKAYELARRSFFDRRDAVLIEYDVNHLLRPPTAEAIGPQEFSDTVAALIEPTLWGDRARLGIVGTTLLIHAHPRIHDQVADLLARIEDRYEHQRAELRATELQRSETRRQHLLGEIVRFERSAERLEGELRIARQDLFAARKVLFRVESDMRDREPTVEELVEHAAAQDEIETMTDRVQVLETRSGRLRGTISDYMFEVSSLEALIASEGASGPE
ncbi:MAG: permease prefix domain 1-containing protein [Planctomycetota bacterium]